MWREKTSFPERAREVVPLMNVFGVENMADELKKCAGCGEMVAEYSYGNYCYTCADAVTGIPPVKEDNLFYLQWKGYVDKLQEPCNDDIRKAIGKLLGEFPRVDWKCQGCGKVQLKKEEQRGLSMDERKDAICCPCECGEKRPAKPDEPEADYW